MDGFVSCPLRVLFCLLGLVVIPPAARAQLTQPDLRKFVRESLHDRTYEIYPPRISFEKNALRVDLGGLKSKSDFGVWSRAVELQFLVEGIRVHRDSPLQQKNWAPYLTRVEAVIEKEVALITAYERARKKGGRKADLEAKETALHAALEEHDEVARRILLSHLDAVAEKEGKVVRPFRRDFPVESPYCSLTIVTHPKGAEVYLLPKGEYRMKERARLAENPDNWDRATGEKMEISGNYYIFARWPGKGKTNPKLVSVSRDTTVTLELSNP
jgi:hypothetical protein